MPRRALAAALPLAAIAGLSGVPLQPSAAAAATPTPLVQTVPAARSVYQLHDSAGHTMDTAKVVADPTTAGRYLAVYHWVSGATFRVGVATSTDLIRWTYRRTLDRNGSQPTIAFSPAPKNGPIVALEGKPHNNLRFRYWTSVAKMLGRSAPHLTFDAPKRLSGCAEGTPDLRAVSYASRKSTITSGSTITVGHHYFADCTTDRQALGKLRNFRTWTTAPRPALDRRLVDAGATGKHGDRDTFTYHGTSWAVYEGGVGPASGGRMADWRTYLVGAAGVRKLDIQTTGRSKAFANPAATVLRDPAGVPSLLMSVFIPGDGAAPGEAGQLIYWQPLDATPLAAAPARR